MKTAFGQKENGGKSRDRADRRWIDYGRAHPVCKRAAPSPGLIGIGRAERRSGVQPRRTPVYGCNSLVGQPPIRRITRPTHITIRGGLRTSDSPSRCAGGVSRSRSTDMSAKTCCQARCQASNSDCRFWRDTWISSRSCSIFWWGFSGVVGSDGLSRRESAARNSITAPRSVKIRSSTWAIGANPQT